MDETVIPKDAQHVLDGTGCDLTLTNSDLRVGIEVEFPRARRSSEKMRIAGRESGELRDRVRDDNLPFYASAHHDGTVGLEIVANPPVPLNALADWYAGIIEYVEDNYDTHYAPVGLLTSGSTAGTHMHLSPLDEEQASALYQFSQEDWAHVLFCSSIAETDDGSVNAPVFRGGQYCTMHMTGGSSTGPGRTHYHVVNERGGGRWEWRLPEPTTPRHMHVISAWLRVFEQDTDVAREFGEALVNSGTDAITALERAATVDYGYDETADVARRVAETGGDVARDFYEEVSDSPWLPFIFRVDNGDGEFYTFRSEIQDTFEVAGIEFEQDDVIRADSMEIIDENEVHDDAQRLTNRFHSDADATRNDTPAGRKLKDIMAEKGGAN